MERATRLELATASLGSWLPTRDDGLSARTDCASPCETVQSVQTDPGCGVGTGMGTASAGWVRDDQARVRLANGIRASVGRREV